MRPPKYLIGLIKEKKHQLPLVLFIGLGILSFIFDFGIFSSKNEAQKNLKENSQYEAPDTIIPKGYVLVPIDLANSEALGAIIDQFAIVDLYTSSLPGEKGGMRVGQKLRLIRAPLNPKTFAVLVPESEASKVVGAAGPVVAVLQNKNQNGLGSIDEKNKKKSNVQYYN
jgi:hypothetical protein